MPSSVWSSALTWAPVVSKRVWNGTAWVRVIKEKVWNGTSWVLAWVHPVTSASLSLSKTGVYTGEAYNVTLTAPGTYPNGGFPEGATVTFRFTGYSYTTYPTEGANSVTLSKASHAVAGNFDWYADVVTKGGNTTFGPLRQTSTVQTGAVTLAGPAWVLSKSQSGSGGSATIQPADFTITLSTPALVASMKFQLSLAGGAWTDYGSWTSPGATTIHSQVFNTTGDWDARVVVTQTNQVVIYSAVSSIYCYKKSLAITASPSAPTTGQVVKLTASHTGDPLGSTKGRWRYYYQSAWHDNWSTANPVNWTAVKVDITWQWVEDFADGSVIYSNQIAMSVEDPPPIPPSNEYVLNGTAHCHDIQAAMQTARTQGKTLVMNGKFYLYTNVYIPDGLSINATGATIYCNSKSAAAGATYDAGRFRNSGKWPDTGEMPSSTTLYNAGGFTWEGGTLDGNGEGIFTISHSPGYTIKNATFYRYCSSGNTGHAIESNSSGGNNQALGGYTVYITGNKFRGTDRGQRANANDEPVHYDWAWAGSGCSGAEDHTMCHNHYIASNSFHRLSESSPWEFAKTAIGGHKMASSSYGVMGNAGVANPSDGLPAERHNGFMITGNAIHGAVGATENVTPNKGAVALWSLRDARVNSNNFYGCTDSRLVSGFDETKNLNSADCNISCASNTHNGAAKTITMPADNTTGG